MITLFFSLKQKLKLCGLMFLKLTKGKLPLSGVFHQWKFGEMFTKCMDAKIEKLFA